jgi:hypothetical protein
MDIIPIIYTVLVIVIILTIFTLFLSFYSSRKEHKKAVKIPTSKPKPLQHNSFLNKSENLKPISIITPKKTIQIRTEKNIKSFDIIEPESKKIRSDNIQKENKKKLIRNSRLEILNSTQGNDESNIRPKIRNEETSNLKSLGNNILENYSDEEKNDMFTLKVKDENAKLKNKS